MVGDAVADIDRRDVRDWFASLRATPVAADRSMPVLSVIMREAEAMGLRPQGSNPCLGIRRYRHKGRARLLSDEEMRRLSARLSAHAGTSPQQVAVVRLLLLTECRKSEILTLRWSDYREGHPFSPRFEDGCQDNPPQRASAGGSGRDEACRGQPLCHHRDRRGRASHGPAKA